MMPETISHFEILDKVGEGGMGIVYRARDTQLDRVVALKVLPAGFNHNPERRQRFLQEARSASALNHPNIVTIYETGQSGDVDYIAMEYLAGKPLDAIVAGRGLRLEEALPLAAQIAGALAAAHSAGIVHRDLKPANIIVSADGVPKVLDFGLAKRDDPWSGEASATAETVAIAGDVKTREGAILGTVAYMSPEQAEGKPVDARSDIFSFGSVLYEMLSGKPAFRGESVVSTLSAVLRDDPAPLDPMPAEVRRILARCLQKDPNRRYQCAADLRLSLLEAREDFAAGKLPGAAPATAPPRPRRWIPAAALGMVALLAVAAWWWMARQADSARTPFLMQVTGDSGIAAMPAVSPDGKLLAYISDRSGEDKSDLYVQQAAGGQPLLIANAASDPDFSPDGTRIAYRSARDGGIYVVPALGGEPSLIARPGRTPRFSPDGRFLAYWDGIRAGRDTFTAGHARSYIVPSAGGAPRPLHPEFESAAYPAWAPDGSHVIFVGRRARTDRIPGDGVEWYVAPAAGGEPVAAGAAELLDKRGPGQDLNLPQVLFAGPQWLLFAGGIRNNTDLWRVAVSPRTWQVGGVPQRVTFGARWAGFPSVAADGAIYYATGSWHTDLFSQPVDANAGKVAGPPEQITFDAAEEDKLSVSESGERLLFTSSRGGRWDIWMRDKTGRESALVPSPSFKQFPQISRDGSLALYVARENGVPVVYRVSVPSGLPEPVSNCSGVEPFTPDGSRFMCIEEGGAQPRRVTLAGVSGGKKRPLLEHQHYSIYDPRFSPDGRFIAFLAWTAFDKIQVFVAPYNENAAVPVSAWIPVTTENISVRPVWSPDGNLIYYVSNRDDHLCIWAQRLDLATKRPSGEPFGVEHFHSLRRSWELIGLHRLDMVLGGGRLFFNQGAATGNIWMTRLD